MSSSEIFTMYALDPERPPKLKELPTPPEGWKFDWDFVFEHTKFSVEDKLEVGALAEGWGDYFEGNPVVVNLTQSMVAVMNPIEKIQGAVVIGSLGELADQMGVDAERIKADVEQALEKQLLERAQGRMPLLDFKLSADELHKELHKLTLKVGMHSVREFVPIVTPEEVGVALIKSDEWLKAVDKLVHELLEKTGAVDVTPAEAGG